MRTFGALVSVGLAAPYARAVDGVIEINQAKALAGGVTPGDTSGFPVTLSQRGSYRLTGNLGVFAANAIEITADDVTLDLNGTCGPSPMAALPTGPASMWVTRAR